MLHVKKVKCSACGRSFAPLPRHINVRGYQTESNEFERLVVEAASETGYRRGMAQLARDGRSAPPFRTANSRTPQTDCDRIRLPADACGVVSAGKEEKDRPSPLKLYAGHWIQGRGGGGEGSKGGAEGCHRGQ